MNRLGIVDLSFLFAESRATPMHTAGIMLFSYPDGVHKEWLHDSFSTAPDTSSLQPPFNLRLTRSMSQLGLPHWTTDEALDTEYHIRHSALPSPGRYREMFSLISRLHGTRLDRDRPLWEAHVIEGVEGNRFAFYMKMHHAMIDGIGSLRMLMDCLTPNPDKRGMPAPWSTPRPSSDARPTPGDKQGALSTAVGAVRGLGRYATEARDDSSGLMAPFAAPQTMLNKRITGSRRFVAQSWSLSRIKTLGESLDATVNDIVMAMSGGALRTYLTDHDGLPDKPLTALTPVSFRALDTPSDGNAFSAVFVSLGTEIPDAVSRLRAIQMSMGRAKRVMASLNSSEIPLYTSFFSTPMLAQQLLRLDGRSRPGFNVTVSNVPGPRETLYWNGAKLQGMYPLSIVNHGAALNITVTSMSDSLNFGIVACRRSVPQAQRLIDHLDEALRELEKGAGVTS